MRDRCLLGQRAAVPRPPPIPEEQEVGGASPKRCHVQVTEDSAARESRSASHGPGSRGRRASGASLRGGRCHRYGNSPGLVEWPAKARGGAGMSSEKNCSIRL